MNLVRATEQAGMITRRTNFIKVTMRVKTYTLNLMN